MLGVHGIWACQGSGSPGQRELISSRQSMFRGFVSRKRFLACGARGTVTARCISAHITGKEKTLVNYSQAAAPSHAGMQPEAPAKTPGMVLAAVITTVLAALSGAIGA